MREGYIGITSASIDKLLLSRFRQNCTISVNKLDTPWLPDVLNIAHILKLIEFFFYKFLVEACELASITDPINN